MVNRAPSGRPVARRPRLLYVVNDASFFVSHRLPLGIASLEAGYDVCVCAGPSAAEEVIRARGMRFFPLNIVRGSRDPVQELATALDLAKVYLRERPDLIHHVTIKPVIYGSLIAKALGLKRVVNAVSGLGYVFIPRREDRWANRALRRCAWLAYRLALRGEQVRVIFQNEDDRATFVAEKVISSGRSSVVNGSGVDFAEFFASPLPAGPFLAILPARLLYDKGVGEFVACARRLRQRYPDTRFALLGKIDLQNPAGISEETVRGWAAEGVIEWWGELSRAQMPGAYAQAHVVVLPSYREGLPLALAEAAASGRACITTNVPGCRDTVRDGETGWLVQVRDEASLERALEHSILDRAELERRGHRASQFARSRFGVDDVVARTLSIYRLLLEERSPVDDRPAAPPASR